MNRKFSKETFKGLRYKFSIFAISKVYTFDMLWLHGWENLYRNLTEDRLAYEKENKWFAYIRRNV